MKTIPIPISCLFVVILVSPVAAEPETLFSTFGPNYSFDRHHGCSVGGPKSPIGKFVAGFPFTPEVTAHLDSIDIAACLSSGTNSYQLSIRAADGTSGGPGKVLETIKVVGKLKRLGQNNLVLRLESSSELLLKSGQKYWLVATAEKDTHMVWNTANLAVKGPFYSIQGGRTVMLSNQSQTAFQINGTPVLQE